MAVKFSNQGNWKSNIVEENVSCVLTIEKDIQFVGKSTYRMEVLNILFKDICRS